MRLSCVNKYYLLTYLLTVAGCQTRLTPILLPPLTYYQKRLQNEQIYTKSKNNAVHARCDYVVRRLGHWGGI